MWSGCGAIRGGAERAWERAHGWVWALVSQLRPGMSLASGSVLVLLTLFLPIAYEACGPQRKGHEFIRGEGVWPGLLTLVSPWVERGFYVLALALAGCTLLLVLISLRRSGFLRKGALSTWLFAIAGALSLFVITDFFWVFAGLWLEPLFQRLEVRDDATAAVLAALTFLVLVSCLRSRFLRTQRWIVALVAAASALSLTVIADFFLSLLTPYGFLREATSAGMVMAPALLYWLVPLILWLRFGLFGRSELRAQWPGIRRRVVQMYTPLVVLDCLFFSEVVKMGIWGFLPFFFGVHLVSLGYMQLARTGEQPRTSEPVGVPSG
jgi:hypothetical protein